MQANTKLISVGNFDFKLNHLLVIGILILAFSISFLLRVQPAQFGYELNEFDPFFNYRATQYILDNGINEYFEWNDSLSWYPDGRNVSGSSQVFLPNDWIFEEDLMTLILFPTILVRVIGGTAGLFSAFYFFTNSN